MDNVLEKTITYFAYNILRVTLGINGKYFTWHKDPTNGPTLLSLIICTALFTRLNRVILPAIAIHPR